MKRFYAYLIFISLFISFNSYGQEFLVKGKIVDAATGSPIEAATIYAETLRDSSLITYTITNAQGVFALEGKTAYKKARLAFSSNGYQSQTKEVTLEPVIEMGTIKMEEQVQLLEGIDLVGERVPITIKKDTLEFNADSFKTRPDATVEDVLKKLPGVEVDSDGTITVNGKEVNQVLVNGQVFFSTDPKVATKTLSKDIISKIQITDTKTKEQEFVGEEGDGENKTINLTLKEDKNKGYMGRLSGGYGTDDRYQANGLINYFNDTQRISVLGSSNNINNPGFSFDEIYEMVGNARGGGGVGFNRNGGFSIGNMSFGFGQGITTSSTLGASFADQDKGKYRVDGNYFFSYSDSYNDEKISRENILPDGRFFTDTETSFVGTTNSNQGSANLEFDIDKTTRITIQPNLSVNNTNSTNAENTESRDENGNLINQNNSLETTDGFRRNFSNRVELMKKLDTVGGYVRLYFNNNNSVNDSESFINSQSSIFGDDPSEQELDQQTIIDNSNDSYEVGAALRQPLNKDLYLDFRYSYEKNEQKNERSVSNFDEVSGVYVYNSMLSSDFNFNTNKHSPEIRFGSNGKKFRFNVRARLEQIALDNEDFIQSTTFSKDYSKVLLGSFFNYNVGSKRLSIRYNSRLNLPSVTQLQPVPNVSNPLNIIEGNPNLGPEVVHSVYFNFNNYNWKDRTGLFAYSGINFEQDKVVSITTTDENFIRTTTYENVDGNYNGWMGVNYSKQIKKDSTYTLKFTIGPSFNISKQVGFTNGRRLEAKNFSFNPRLGLLFNYKEMLEIEPEYRIGVSSTRYNLDNVEDIDFTTHNVALKLTSYWPKNVVFGNDITYSYNGNLGDGFDKDAIFWNMSLGLQMFKKKATLKVLAYDLLNQNINTRRTTGQDFIQDFQGTVLKRYFMGSLTIKFDSFGGKGAPNKRGGGPRFMRL